MVNVPVVRRYFLAISELNDISVDIHVKDTVHQRNLNFALNRFIEDNNIPPG